MRKKVFALLLTVSMTVTLCGCGSGSASSDADTPQEMEPSENISEEEPKKETPNAADTTAKEDESPTADTPAQEKIEGVIDNEDLSISSETDAKTYLSDLDIHPLYASFLRNEISVANPHVAEGASNTELSILDDREYDSTFDNPEKGFYLLDLTGDGCPELLFEIRNRWGSDRLLYILGIRDDELICYDLFETHTSHIGFAVYDNGVVESGYRFQDGEADSVYYRYNTDGSTYELIHFFRNIDPGADLDLSHIYDYYYLDGNRDVLYELHSDEEYESVIEPYLGEFPEWLDCKDFADIPY